MRWNRGKKHSRGTARRKTAIYGSSGLILLFLARVIFAGDIASALNSLGDLASRVTSYLRASARPPAVGGPVEPEKLTIRDLEIAENTLPLVSEEFADNIRQWQKAYFEERDEAWCAESDDYPLPSMYYMGAYLRLALRKLVVEYKSSGFEYGVNPFVVSLGQGNGREYLQLLVQEGESHLLGIAKVVGGAPAGELTREPRKRSLTDPIKPGTDVKITLRAKSSNKSVIEYELLIDYVSAQTGRPLQDPFLIEVESPHISPDQVEVQLGLGTERGGCITPLRYEIY